MRIAIAAILGGIVMFLWGGVAHTMLPLGEFGVHTATEQNTAFMAITRSATTGEGTSVRTEHAAGAGGD